MIDMDKNVVPPKLYSSTGPPDAFWWLAEQKEASNPGNQLLPFSAMVMDLKVSGTSAASARGDSKIAIFRP
jgi:hypothetical protein